MSPQILEHLRYDSFGNNPSLLTENDKLRISKGDYARVCGEALCPECNLPYRMHPEVQGALWLNRACPDQLIKL